MSRRSKRIAVYTPCGPPGSGPCGTRSRKAWPAPSRCASAEQARNQGKPTAASVASTATTTSASTSEKPRELHGDERRGGPGSRPARPPTWSASGRSPRPSATRRSSRSSSRRCPSRSAAPRRTRTRPAFSRYSTMRPASVGPTPGSVISSSIVAVLMLTFSVGAALASASAGARGQKGGHGDGQPGGDHAACSHLLLLSRLVSRLESAVRRRLGRQGAFCDAARRPEHRLSLRRPGAGPPHDARERGQRRCQEPSVTTRPPRQHLAASDGVGAGRGRRQPRLSPRPAGARKCVSAQQHRDRQRNATVDRELTAGRSAPASPRCRSRAPASPSAPPSGGAAGPPGRRMSAFHSWARSAAGAAGARVGVDRLVGAHHRQLAGTWRRGRRAPE